MTLVQELYKTYQEQEQDHVLLSYKGIITRELLDSVYQIADAKMESFREDTRVRKKVYNVLVESLQNMFHHIDEIWQVAGSNGFNSKDALFSIRRNDEGVYTILTGNYVFTEKCELLKSKIDKVNSLSVDELRDHYVDKLNTTELSAKGGAGLGFIDIARKSGNKLSYEIIRISDKYSFFSLQITVK